MFRENPQQDYPCQYRQQHIGLPDVAGHHASSAENQSFSQVLPNTITLKTGCERAFISNCQELGYIHDGELAIVCQVGKSCAAIPGREDGEVDPI